MSKQGELISHWLTCTRT